MNISKIMNGVVVVFLASVSLSVAGTMAVGTGSSTNANSRLAGEEAARKAKEGLGAAKPRVVLVFAARKQLDADLVAGVGTMFDKALIYGCEGYSPLTADGNFADQGHGIGRGVAVLAIGGELGVTAASEPVAPLPDKNQAFTQCGRKLGEELKVGDVPGTKGRLVLTFGNQHVGDNVPYVAGLAGSLGTNTPVVGAAAGGPEAKEIVAGKVVQGVNVAILLTGNFKVGVGLAGGDGDLVGKTGESLTTAFAAAGGTPVLALIFDCGGRRGELVKQGKIVDELARMKEISRTASLFGFYGGAEIGCKAMGLSPCGVGFSVASAVLSVE